MRTCISRFAEEPVLRERAAAKYSDLLQLELQDGQQRDTAGDAILSVLVEADTRVRAEGLALASQRERRVSAAVQAADAAAARLPPLGADALHLAAGYSVLLGSPGSCMLASMLMAEAALLLQLQGAGLAPNGPVQLKHEFYWERPPNLLNVGSSPDARPRSSKPPGLPRPLL
jgi:hypothetical protein